MGTRSLTRVIDQDKRILVVMYRQFDGYPEGHGAELCDFLKPMKMVNGYTNPDAKNEANGAGCLAAQLVAHFKTGVGGFYLEPTDTTDSNQDFEYDIRVVGQRDNARIWLDAYECPYLSAKTRKLLFSVLPENMDLVIEQYVEAQENE